MLWTLWSRMSRAPKNSCSRYVRICLNIKWNPIILTFTISCSEDLINIPTSVLSWLLLLMVRFIPTKFLLVTFSWKVIYMNTWRVWWDGPLLTELWPQELRSLISWLFISQGPDCILTLTRRGFTIAKRWKYLPLTSVTILWRRELTSAESDRITLWPSKLMKMEGWLPQS